MNKRASTPFFKRDLLKNTNTKLKANSCSSFGVVKNVNKNSDMPTQGTSTPNLNKYLYQFRKVIKM